MIARPLPRFLRFGVVGTIGFLVDGGILFVLVSVGVNPYLARAISFPIAVSATWYLNANWTFAAAEAMARPRRKYLLYFMLQIVGALVNYGCYALVLSFVAATPLNALFALAVGSCAGLFVNYSGSSLLVFKN